MNKPGNPTTTAHPDVRISATNLGPIASCAVDLRPLTVFVGPSNAGKTYFAILIYALHRVLTGFPRFPFTHRYRYQFGQGLQLDKLSVADADVRREELADVLEKLDTEERPFRFSDLPGGVRKIAHVVLKDPKMLGEVLRAELARCFDLKSLSDLVRSPGRLNKMTVSLDISEKNQRLWHFDTEISKSEITTDGQIEDMVLLPKGWAASKSKRIAVLRQFRDLTKGKLGIISARNRWYLEELFENLFYIAASTTERGGTHYLPAARSGIMQSHRVIASSLVARSTRAGLERFPELPTFSGVMADFMQRLILYEEDRATNRPMSDLADALEREALTGRIRTSRPPGGGYPEFVYRPQNTKQDIRLSRASSMVSELAPVVLFLRGTIERDDMLIIEEPEAHLHPAAQTQMAVTLARMVRAGVRVVVTTHSDWLLKEIGNLMREGELGEQTSEHTGKVPPPSSLRPDDVGVWLFRKDKMSAGSTVEEIPFDRSEGVEPQDYENVAEELYNRSANLQNRLEETAKSAGSENE